MAQGLPTNPSNSRYTLLCTHCVAAIPFYLETTIHHSVRLFESLGMDGGSGRSCRQWRQIYMLNNDLMFMLPPPWCLTPLTCWRATRWVTGWFPTCPQTQHEVQVLYSFLCMIPGTLLLKLKIQYFGHLMWRVDSLVKTLMLGNKTEGSRRGRQMIEMVR